MPNIPDILKIIEDGAFTPEEQLTLVKYLSLRRRIRKIKSTERRIFCGIDAFYQ